jgi:formylglycine-generating enzyme required for sulfatase activity
VVIAHWAEALGPVRQHLLPPLAAVLAEEAHDLAGRRTIIRLYGDYAKGLSDALAPLEKIAAGPTKPADHRDDRLAQQRRQANAAAALAALGRWDPVRRLLRHTSDPTVRSYLIDRLGPYGADARVLLALLNPGEEVSVRRAALLALGQFDEDGLPLAERARLVARLIGLYRDDPDPGIHGAAGWLLGRWGQRKQLKPVDRSLATPRPHGPRNWYINGQGQTMVLLAPGTFQRGEGKGMQRGQVNHRFALAAREVSVAEFLRFERARGAGNPFARTGDCPVNEVSWYDAAAYCNWLSAQEGIPEEQRCYLPNAKGEYAAGMQVAPDFMSRSGYRLPTSPEWEYACRAGSVTSWSMGEADALVPKYGWCLTTSSNRLHPVGTLCPNDWGLFDMHGNAFEWCQDGPPPGQQRGPLSAGVVITDACHRVARGGAFGHGALGSTSASKVIALPTERGIDLGFRPARTLR